MTARLPWLHSNASLFTVRKWQKGCSAPIVRGLERSFQSRPPFLIANCNPYLPTYASRYAFFDVWSRFEMTLTRRDPHVECLTSATPRRTAPRAVTTFSSQRVIVVALVGKLPVNLTRLDPPLREASRRPNFTLGNYTSESFPKPNTKRMFSFITYRYNIYSINLDASMLRFASPDCCYSRVCATTSIRIYRLLYQESRIIKTCITAIRLQGQEKWHAVSQFWNGRYFKEEGKRKVETFIFQEEKYPKCVQQLRVSRTSCPVRCQFVKETLESKIE